MNVSIINKLYMKSLYLGLMFLITLVFSSCGFMCNNEDAKDSNVLYSDLSDKWTYRPKTEAFIFQSHDVKLCGRVLMASGVSKKPTIVFLHGMPGFEKNSDIGQALRRGGCNCVYFSYTGSWGNKGAFDFKNSVDDTNALIRFLKNNSDYYKVDMSNLFLCGFSMGADVAFIAANRSNDVKGVISISPWDAYKSLNKKSQKMKIKYAKWLETLPAVNINNGKEFMDSILTNKMYSLKNILGKLGIQNLHLFQNTTEKSSFIKGNIISNKDKIVVVNACDHSFSNKRIALTNYIYKWINKDIKNNEF